MIHQADEVTISVIHSSYLVMNPPMWRQKNVWVPFLTTHSLFIPQFLSLWTTSFHCNFCFCHSPDDLRAHSHAYLFSLPSLSVLTLEPIHDHFRTLHLNPAHSRMCWCTDIDGRMTKAQLFLSKGCLILPTQYTLCCCRQTNYTSSLYTTLTQLFWTSRMLVVSG